ncbi:hypothetical protein VHEMI09752 [[Torrubiella] hemipterigena]|uniref:Peroxisomal membrane protein PEX14 n=1 Tax=[Torrubiella] hemipterigena TaxID=1531966 RepID=A0A0A1TQY9_9HYPO|nr:hypothetical protein VHEMI09752 [[Torrubiella] hemipterigena]
MLLRTELPRPVLASGRILHNYRAHAAHVRLVPAVEASSPSSFTIPIDRFPSSAELYPLSTSPTMAIREELVASATQFLQDPSVASSSVENRITFLRSKNLTQEEIDVAMSRTGAGPPPPPPGASPYANAVGPAQPYYQPYSQYAWQPPPQIPRRDWRDWFIMATVVSGVSYGLYSLGKRYVYPLVAPPTPEKLEQDKQHISDQFDRAFNLVEQLAKDTEDLKKTEQLRSEKLDTALTELETVMAELKTANRRRDDDALRIRDEIQALKDAIPKAMEGQKKATDNRLYEINTELTSLKTIISQRMATASKIATTTPASPAAPASPAVPSPKVEDAPETPEPAAASTSSEPPKTLAQGAYNKTTRLSGSSGKPSIPAWQVAMANKNNATAEGSSSSS